MAFFVLIDLSEKFIDFVKYAANGNPGAILYCSWILSVVRLRILLHIPF